MRHQMLPDGDTHAIPFPSADSDTGSTACRPSRGSALSIFVAWLVPAFVVVVVVGVGGEGATSLPVVGIIDVSLPGSAADVPAPVGPSAVVHPASIAIVAAATATRMVVVRVAVASKSRLGTRLGESSCSTTFMGSCTAFSLRAVGRSGLYRAGCAFTFRAAQLKLYGVGGAGAELIGCGQVPVDSPIELISAFERGSPA